MGLETVGKILEFQIVQFDERNEQENNEKIWLQRQAAEMLRELDFILWWTLDVRAEK